MRMFASLATPPDSLVPVKEDVDAGDNREGRHAPLQGSCTDAVEEHVVAVLLFLGFGLLGIPI